MTPLTFLLLLLVITLAAAGAEWIVTRRRRRKLRTLAARWQMHYTPGDRFRLAPRVAGRLPAVGAAAVRVKDLIYGIEGEQYRYVFSAEYTVGTVRSQRRLRSVCTFAEPRERRTDPADFNLVVAPDSMTLTEQYEHLRQQVASARESLI